MRAQDKMKCSLLDDKKTRSMVQDTAVRLSAAVAHIICDKGITKA